ncbi:MAG: 2-amino-4-hydroxy-6-hydroxymethyldihydropteridine diphosphokinase [Desulfobacterales bacterium]
MERMNIHTAYIGAGSNIGNKLLNCKNGIIPLTKLQNTQITEWSKFYQTEPVDYRNQNWFINCVFKIKTDLNPYQLIKTLKSIEYEAGRMDDTVRFGPRILDLDILLFDDIIMDSSGLIIPHPRMHKRRFVLKPICDIDPSIVHPVLKKEMHKLLTALDENDQRIVEYQCDY